MNEYKLDAHLEALCHEHPEYANLYSTWSLNKHTCTEVLKSVVIHYPHFSMHDASHAETVVSKIEMLLGERIQNLSPTDTWLLLHAAYAHDLGMVLRWEQIKNVWESPEFQSFISSLSNSPDGELRNAADFIHNMDNISTNPLWPLKAHRYVNLINAQFFRSQHGKLSNTYIQTTAADLGLDLGHNNLIQLRMLKLLGNICEMHTRPLSEVLSLDYQTDGVGSDYAHPRFVAMFLRLGDLLDIDNGRFNTACESAFGGLPEASIPHREKHEATTHLLVTPEEIQFRSDCPDSQAYLETRNFVTWLEDEIDFLTKYWSKIAPSELGGYAPCFNRKELLINGIPDIEGVAGLRFEISQKRAFQIIEGSSIYEDRFVFIRELIQNAMDASKVQLWRDLVSGNYRAWIGNKDLDTLQPYDLHQKIYESYPVDIRLSTLPDGATQVEITDRGTGISVETFKQMCNVGTSNTGSKQIQTDINSMPNWLRPTAGFGIGLQSIFLVADQFEIFTGTGTESFYAIVHANRLGGYLQLQKASVRNTRGTTIRLSFHMPENFRYSMAGDTDNYLELHYDPFSEEDHTGEARVLESIRNNCGETMFPLHAACTENALDDFNCMDLLPICDSNDLHSWTLFKDRYYLALSKDYGQIRIWDTQLSVYAEFQMVQIGFQRTDIRFKGIDVKKGTPNLRRNGFSTLFDVYGLDTKDVISLDRSTLTSKGRKQIILIIEDFFQIYKEYVLGQLLSVSPAKRDEICQAGKFNPYIFWRICNLKQRTQIPEDLLNHISDSAVVLSYNQGHFVHKERPISESIPFLSDVYYINLRKFEKNDGSRKIDYNALCNILDQAHLNDIEIIADSILTEESQYLYLHTLQMPLPEKPLLLYSVTSQNDNLIEVGTDMKNTLLRGLSSHIPLMDYNSYYSQKYKAKRYAIPAFQEYAVLAVDEVPYGVAHPNQYRHYYIIAPFIREDVETLTDLSKAGFVEQIVAAKTFSKIVDYVLQHSIQKESASQTSIINAYKRLIEEYYDVMQETPHPVPNIN